MSLVSRLLEWLFPPLLFLWLATSILTFVSLHNLLDDSVDQRLMDASVHVHRLWQGVGRSESKVRPLLLGVGGENARSFKVAILDGSDNEIVSTFALPVVIGSSASRDVVEIMNIDDTSAHCALRRFDGETAFATRVLVCDLSDTRTVQSLVLFRHIVGPQSLILLIAMALVWYGLGYILRPLSVLRMDLDKREIDDLRAINLTGAPKELEPLLSAINHLMQRLSAGFDSQRRFIANAAHQLRTPLAAINTRIELAQQLLRDGKASQASEVLDAQSKLTARTTRLANQLLTLARSETPQTDDSKSVVLITQCVANVLARIGARAQENQIELTYEEIGDTPRWHLEGNQTMIEEAIANVLENAIAAAPSASEVQCVADASVGEIRIYDAGEGIDPSERERIFLPFVRGATSAHPGSGLGLTIVREIMRQHGGDVTLADRMPARGACVILAFKRTAN